MDNVAFAENCSTVSNHVPERYVAVPVPLLVQTTFHVNYRKLLLVLSKEILKTSPTDDASCSSFRPSREKKTPAQERPNLKHAASALRNRRCRGKRPDRDRVGRLDAERPRPPAGGCKCTPLSWILSMCRSSLVCGFRRPPT